MSRTTCRTKVLPLLAVLSLLGGCAGNAGKGETVDTSLADARAAYRAAAADPEVNRHGGPALQQAAQALQQAEQGDAEQSQHFSYLALRHVQIAQAQTRAAQARQRVETLQQQVESRQPGPSSPAAEGLTEPAMQAHRRAQQARDTALAAQIAATAASESDSETVRQLTSDLAALEVETESTSRGLVVVVEDPHAGGRSATELFWATKLAPVVAFLNEHPERAVIVEGHTDDRLPLPDSLRQSQAKAQALRSLLVRAGVQGQRIEARGMGPDVPVASNDTAAGRARNRRVEVVIGPSPE